MPIARSVPPLRNRCIKFLGCKLPNMPQGTPDLELFMTQLAGIAPNSDRIAPGSDLIEDLGFEETAFSELADLLHQSYGIGGLSTAALTRPTGRVTVENFFLRCVLEVLGLAPRETGAKRRGRAGLAPRSSRQ